MSVESSRDKILGRIKDALSKGQKNLNKPDFSRKLYNISNDDKAVLFAENLIRTKAEFLFCENISEFIEEFAALAAERGYKNIAVWEKELQKMLPKLFEPYMTTDTNFANVEIGITLCECLISRLGSVLISSRQYAGRRLAIYPPISIVVAFTSQLVDDIADGLTLIKQKYQDNFPSMVCLTTGPSRTADIEKTLVLGAHGPKELIVFLIDDTV